MPTPRKRPPTPAKSDRAAASSAAPKPSAAPGEAAHARLQPRLAALPKERVVQPRADVRAAAAHVLSDTVPRLSDPALRARFGTLPATEFDHAALPDLEAAAQALLWAQSRLAAAEAGETGARLPVALLGEATALRQDMLDVCTYHFRGDARVGRQLDDIRSGKGYLDLAQDLSRLAALYRDGHATLAQDGRFYRPEDADTAEALSQRITRELRPKNTQPAREQVWRTWALLLALYEEVARGGRFLLRDEGERAFPPLHNVGRAGARKGKSQPAQPAPAP